MGPTVSVHCSRCGGRRADGVDGTESDAKWAEAAKDSEVSAMLTEAAVCPHACAKVMMTAATPAGLFFLNGGSRVPDLGALDKMVAARSKTVIHGAGGLGHANL